MRHFIKSLFDKSKLRFELTCILSQRVAKKKRDEIGSNPKRLFY